ncbi:UPF0496 protein 4-like [Wolffia australiana]
MHIRSLYEETEAQKSFQGSLAPAVEAASSAHRLLENLLYETHLREADVEPVVSFLSASVKLLDLCNAISDQINKLCHERLLALLALQLLSSPSSENISRARELLRGWESVWLDGDVGEVAGELVKRVVRERAPAEGAVARAVCAVGGVSALVAGLFLRGGAPAEFEGFGAAVGRCLLRISTGGFGEEREELAAAAERLGEGLDCLGAAVESLFRSVLRSRNAALRSYGLPRSE